MSERIKKIIGEELYNQIITAGLKANEFDLLDGFIPKARFNEVNDKYKTANEKITSYEDKLKETEKLISSNDELKGKYDTLSTKYTEDLSNKDKELINITKRFKLENELLKEGAKYPSLLLKNVDLEKISLDNDNLVGWTDVLKDLKTDYSDMFTIKQTKTKINPKPKSNVFVNNKENDNDDGNMDWTGKFDHLVSG
jgi:predicted nuclease with TOPRIM domain